MGLLFPWVPFDQPFGGIINIMKYKDQQDVLNFEKINDLLDDMPAFMRDFANEYRGNQASTRTILGYIGDIDTFFYYLEAELGIPKKDLTLEVLEKLSALQISQFKGFLVSYKGRDGQIYTNKTVAVNRKLTAVRQLYKFLYNMDMITQNPSVKVSFVPVKAEDANREIVALDAAEVQRLKDSVIYGDGLTDSQQKHNRGNSFRDQAIIVLLLATGMRVSECVGLNLDDFFPDRMLVRITRKGHRRAQEVHINEEAVVAVKEYIQNERRPSELDPDALFISRKGQRITQRSVERLVKKYAAASGTAKKITPHKLRATYGTALYEKTRDINAVVTRLGHSSVDVASKRYIRPSASVDYESSQEDLF